MQPILVTGGTGTLGRLVVSRLRDAGCAVRVLSRRSRAAGEAEEGIELVTGDLATGEGIEALKYAIAEMVAAHRPIDIQPKSPSAEPAKLKPHYPPPPSSARGRA